MFGSQALEVAIGASFFMSVVAMTASGLVESLSRLIRRRANMLVATINRLLSGAAHQPGKVQRLRDLKADMTSDFWKTDAAKAAKAATPALLREGKPNYLRVDTFLDALDERGRITESETEAVWRHRFEEATSQASDSYKRWATLSLFLVSLALCAVGNLSVVAVANALWHQDDDRTAFVADIANGNEPTPIAVSYTTNDCRKDAAETAAGTTPAPFPEKVVLGWRCSPFDQVTDWGDRARLLLGWILTALLSLLGAQFWFDTVGRLVNLRPGSAPSRAAPEADK
jgi:hypothetical protein